ncbi:MAG: MBL fold metallo-hydrolase [Fibrobacter sp.]|nr:MBL fold metallo-hydrolase [Fibrobacter sp.]
MTVKHHFFFKITVCIAVICFFNCHTTDLNESEFIFAVADVGQGLSQIGVQNDTAVVWDLGTLEMFGNVKTLYRKLGSPYIKYIVISHGDLDHCGGLGGIDTEIRWSGRIIVSPFEDTSSLRKLYHSPGFISFDVLSAGKQLQVFGDVNIKCLWPDSTANFADRNASSFVFSLKHGRNSCLITSDIDSITQRKIITGNRSIKTDLMIVPHHGSSDFSMLFFQYVNPEHAIISCARNNSFGHPSQETLKALIALNAKISYTFQGGNLFFRSNNYYWVLY